MPRQHGNIFSAFSQRRHGQLHHRQPVVQILAEFPSAHRFVQVAIGSSDQSNINLNRMRSTHAFEFALLQHAQQLHLQRRSQFSNLVKKYHAAVGNFQTSLLLHCRARERAALMSKQITLQQRLGNGRAIDCHECFVRPMAVTVQRPGH